AADGAEERRRRGGDADVLRRRVVLDDEHEHLHHQPKPDADDDHVGGGDPRRRADGEQREQVHADHEHGGAGDRERRVAADPAARRSHQTKIASRTTPAIPSSRILFEPHAYSLPPQVVSRISAPTPPLRRAVPPTSIRWLTAGVRRCRRVLTISTASAPTGMLT